MITESTYLDKQLSEHPPGSPCVSLIMPFEPKMASRATLDQQLEAAIEKVQAQLLNRYTAKQAQHVVDQLKGLAATLNYATYKKSVAIIATPELEKVYYLDIYVEEKIMVDASFEIRDLVYSKKDIHKYLILVLSSNRSRIFLGNTTRFLRIGVNTPEYAVAYENDPPERVGNFSDPAHRREVLLNKFLHQVDNVLHHVLKAYHLPLFIMTTERTAGHFKAITHHANYITGWVQGNYDEASENDIREAIAPHVADWKKVLQQELLQQLDAAMSANKLAVGIYEAWDTAADNNGRLLVVEKNFVYPADRLLNDVNAGSPYYIKDVVDCIIDKILQNGGDVAFIDEGKLADYGKIALIKYY